MIGNFVDDEEQEVLLTIITRDANAILHIIHIMYIQINYKIFFLLSFAIYVSCWRGEKLEKIERESVNRWTEIIFLWL